MHDQFQHHQGLCGLYQRLSHQQYVTECCATGGFAGVLGPEADNSLVFERAFKVQPSLYEDVKSLQEALRIFSLKFYFYRWAYHHNKEAGGENSGPK